MPTDLRRELKKILSLPIWRAENSHGSMAILEFGQPQLETFRLKGLRSKKGVRRINAVGEYSLHIWHCNWEVYDGETRIGGVKSKGDILNGLQSIKGQLIKIFYVSPSGQETVLGGDEGISIRISPADEMENHWTLYKNTGKKWALFLNKKGKLAKEVTENPTAKKLVWKRK